MSTHQIVESSERIMGAVIVICACAVIAAVLADRLGAVVWLGAG